MNLILMYSDGSQREVSLHCYMGTFYDENYNLESEWLLNGLHYSGEIKGCKLNKARFKLRKFILGLNDSLEIKISNKESWIKKLRKISKGEI